MSGVSFEFFPGRGEKGSEQLVETVELLSQLQPDFQTVTFGAGGSDKAGTYDTVCLLERLTGVETASHLTYSGLNQDEVAAFADDLWSAGVRRLVALRGDLSGGNGNHSSYQDTAEFIRSLKSRHPFQIAVACYPETHPMAASPEADLAVLKEKQDAGATTAISQFFFDNSVFYQFVERARSYGITLPIIPGILPIYNFERVRKIADKCGSSIPQFVSDAFENGRSAGSNDYEIAAELLKAQVHDLAYAGFESIHIYTLNRVSLTNLAVEAFRDAKSSREQNVSLKQAVNA